MDGWMDGMIYATGINRNDKLTRYKCKRDDRTRYDGTLMNLRTHTMFIYLSMFIHERISTF